MQLDAKEMTLRMNGKIAFDQWVIPAPSLLDNPMFPPFRVAL
jgi:hypothetical protein